MLTRYQQILRKEEKSGVLFQHEEKLSKDSHRTNNASKYAEYLIFKTECDKRTKDRKTGGTGNSDYTVAENQVRVFSIADVHGPNCTIYSIRTQADHTFNSKNKSSKRHSTSQVY